MAASRRRLPFVDAERKHRVETEIVVRINHVAVQIMISIKKNLVLDTIVCVDAFSLRRVAQSLHILYHLLLILVHAVNLINIFFLLVEHFVQVQSLIFFSFC